MKMYSFKNYIKQKGKEIAACLFLVISFGHSAERLKDYKKDELKTTDNFKHQSSFHILFVGNSLTYTNNLPKLVEEVGKNNNIKISTETLAYPNYSLADHWQEGIMQTKIAKKHFDFVIVQQGPSSQQDGRDMLFEYGKKISALCKENDAQIVFYMIWPSKVNYNTFDAVIQNYSDAAIHAQAKLCAVGSEFKIIGDRKEFWFYGDDDFHPSLAGSQRAAEIILATLF